MSDDVRADADAPTPPSSLADATVLVTGGAGLVGRRLAALLSPVAEVRVLDHFRTSDPSSLPDGVEVFRRDIRSRAAVDRALEGADVVFHQAARSGPYALDHPLESHEVNATATLSLLEGARQADVRTVVASSAAVYGPARTVPIREDAPKTPVDPYGLQKLTADAYARLYHDLYGLETVVLRYFNVYGYRSSRNPRKNVVNVFVERARDGRTLEIDGDGSQRRDFVHVDDVVAANFDAAVTPHVGEAFNVGTGEGTSIARLAELVQRHAERSRVAAGEARPTDVDESVADLTKARADLGYEPSVSIAEGVASLWEEYRRRDGEPG